MSIYSIDGNVTWRCGEIGIRYALMGKTGSSCMLVRLQPLPTEHCRLFYALMVKWLSQRTHNPLVVGSNPTGRTYGVVAQSEEQGTFNPKVVGSILSDSTMDAWRSWLAQMLYTHKVVGSIPTVSTNCRSNPLKTRVGL